MPAARAMWCWARRRHPRKKRPRQRNDGPRRAQAAGYFKGIELTVRVNLCPGAWNGKPEKDIRELYHVHGFVPGKRHLARGEGRIFPGESGPIILSEDSYYRVEQEEAYNWSSSIQSYFLNRYQCIFVGFSAEDYNFRRILRQIGESGTAGTHYLILSVGRWISDVYEDVCRAHAEQSGGRAAEAGIQRISRDAVLLLRYILACRAAYWKRFNICPIWVTVREIPQLLADLVPG